VIFSGEAAAAFFSYTTSLTKAATAANYIFSLRKLKPAVQEDPSKPPFDDETEKCPAHIEIQAVTFAYESRPDSKVLQGIHVDVSAKTDHSSIIVDLKRIRYGPASS
jgi:ATP-binding cassette subfamily B (MDR/TAP) protein 1